MVNKAIFIALLIVLGTCYTEEDHVLVLTDDDFPSITTEFSHILIEFYAPWCGHCKKLEPVYKEVAAALKEQNSVLRVAKVDATEHKKAAESFEVRGYPTLLFFYNGQKMDYNGPRSKEGMLTWLVKRTRAPVSEIDGKRYAELQQEKSTSVIYHGDFTSAQNAELLSKHAVADDYNNYYWGKDLGKDAGTIEIIRSFDQPTTYGEINEGIKKWISKNERPPVVPFDERTIGDMFSSGKKGVVFFNGDSNEEILNAFTSAAKDYDGEEGLIFTEVSPKNEHLDNFANYIKLDRKAFPIVVIEAKAQNKFVMKSSPTKDNILAFLADHKNHKYGITDEVKSEKAAEEETVAEEQL